MKLHYQYILRSLRVRLVAKAIEITLGYYHLLRRPYAILEHTCFHCLVLLAKCTSGKFELLAGIDFVYSIIICTRSLFYHNFVEIMLEKNSTTDKCQQVFRVCYFHFKIPTTSQKGRVESKSRPESSIC